MPQTFRLSFDISAEADPSDLLDRLIEFQQQLVDELEEGEDFCVCPKTKTAHRKVRLLHGWPAR